MTQDEDERARAINALTLSIEHWERLRDGRAELDETTSASSCACCREYYDSVDPEDSSRNCGQCPIRKRTGLEHCSGTPWRAAHLALRGQEQDPDRTDEQRQECQALIEFLEETRDHIVLGFIPMTPPPSAGHEELAATYMRTKNRLSRAELFISSAAARGDLSAHNWLLAEMIHRGRGER